MTLLFKTSAILFIILLVLGMFVIEAFNNKHLSFKWVKVSFIKKYMVFHITIFVLLTSASLLVMVFTFDDLDDVYLESLMEIKVKYDNNSGIKDIELERLTGTSYVNKLAYYNMIVEVETIDYKIFNNIKTDLLNSGLGSKIKLYLRIEYGGESSLIEITEVDDT